AVLHGFAGFLRGQFALLDALHAHAALLVHAAAAHHHIGVQHHAAQVVPCRVHLAELLGHVVEPVESTHLVGAVVGAVAGTDATVVGHLVQALVAVRGGGHRAHRFARRVVAVLSQHRHQHHPGVLAGHLHPEVH